MGSQRHAPAALHPWNDSVHIVQEAGLDPGPVWAGLGEELVRYSHRGSNLFWKKDGGKNKSDGRKRKKK